MAYQLNIDGVYNVRDLGGYPTVDGGVTRRGVFVRSGLVSNVPESGQQQFIDYGVRAIIDLRSEDELLMAPNSFATSNRVQFHSLPLVNRAQFHSEHWKTNVIAFYPTVQHFYAQHLAYCPDSFRTIISALIDSPEATVFHCFAGKDRTGMTAALLLGAVGVADELIAEDFALTDAGLAQVVPVWRKNALKSGEDMDAFERGVVTKAEAMLELMRHIGQTYGGASGYLRSVGITDEQIARLRARFVEYLR
ncbi:MAG: tyrosine-protein phosphatase [Chloroflexi bacterium]|uniref:tyrosine-protein phosphatase n=1 Tax=Candidatus Flexifilum breve TaxID=3140694 RepID=UPI00313586B4|nr:tyrosine-protein phosphatase [Chloroflexota bacterium]